MRKVLPLLVLLALAPLSIAENELSLARYEGKVVVLDFWASWCVPCRRSFPWMNEMHARYADQGLAIIAVNVDSSAEEAARFLARYPAQFEITYDPQGELAKEYRVEVMPTSIILGRNGEMIVRHAGFRVRQQDDYEATIRAALQLESNK